MCERRKVRGNMKKKSIIVLVLVLAICACILCACDSNPTPEEYINGLLEKGYNIIIAHGIYFNDFGIESFGISAEKNKKCVSITIYLSEDAAKTAYDSREINEDTKVVLRGNAIISGDEQLVNEVSSI